MSELSIKDNTCRVVKRGFSALGTRHEAKYSEYPTVVPLSFDSLLNRVDEIPNRTGAQLALYEPGNFAPDSLGIYYATAQVTEIGHIPQGMVSQITPVCTYAVYTHRGEISKIGDAYGSLNRWIAENGYKHSNGWVVELMDHRFNRNSPESELEIYTPIEEK
ncbi:Bacterial transcription activator, effector binding domain [compost metagenome]